MWHEARKQERKIRGIMVNYKKRAERRRAFYERMKTDPTTFLRIQGSNCKIHIEHQNSDNINMMPWQGDKSVMIDRFDARAHLDYIPEPLFTQSDKSMNSSEEKKLNYERYRTLVMIEASGATEEGYLKQLQQEEENPRAIVEEKKEKLAPKASIGYTYEDTNLVLNDAESESDSESDTDLDIDVAINVDELDSEQREELDSLALKFGMQSGKYCSLLKADKDEAEHVQKVQDEEEARSQLRGRRAKRDRRSLKDRQRGTISTSPLSYLRKASPSYEAYRESRSRSRSSSSGGEPTKVEYITEFGSLGNKDNNSFKNERKKSSSQEEIKSKHKRYDNSDQTRMMSEKHRKSRSARRSRSTSHERHSKHRSRSRSRSYSPSYKRRSYQRSRSRSPSQDSFESGNKRMKVMTQHKKKSDKTKAPLSGDKTKLTPQEKLKKRMQLALNKQLKMDKKEEKKKKEVKEQERQERDDDLREVSKRWKDRKRYRYSRSRSRSYSP